jgi:hypothetical protein
VATTPRASKVFAASLLVVVAVVAAIAGQVWRGSRDSRTRTTTTDGGDVLTATRDRSVDEHLVPLVRARVLFENRRIEASPDPLHALVPAPPHVELTPALWASLAYRTKDGLEPLGEGELANLAGPFASVWPAVLARFARDVRDAQDAPVLGASGVFELSPADGNAAARLLVPSTFAGLPFAGDAVVALPHESRLLVADAASDASLDALANRLKQLWDEAPCDVRAFRVARHGDAGVAVTPFAWRDLESSADQYDATRQKEVLERKLGTGDDAPFLASVKRMRNPQTEEEVSFVVQTEEVRTLLAPAGWVDFRKVDLTRHTATTVGCATWESARTLLGARWRETPLWPPRYETLGFPTTEELAKMGCPQTALAYDLGVARTLPP